MSWSHRQWVVEVITCTSALYLSTLFVSVHTRGVPLKQLSCSGCVDCFFFFLPQKVKVPKELSPIWVLMGSHGPRTGRCRILILRVISYQLIMAKPIQKSKLLISTTSPAFHFLPFRKLLRTSWCPPCSSCIVGVQTSFYVIQYLLQIKKI